MRPMTTQSPSSLPPVSLCGEVTQTPAHPVIVAMLTVSGLLLVRGILTLVARYCLGLTAKAQVAVEGGSIKIDTTWMFFGKKIRRSASVSPIRRIDAVRFENRQRMLYWVIGFGALTTGAFIGIQWFLDGLHAGYPYLTAAGALMIAAGAATDILIYLFVPKGKGRSHLILALGPWTVRLSGVNTEAAEQLISSIHSSWSVSR
jgi:hypothetical protein